MNYKISMGFFLLHGKSGIILFLRHASMEWEKYLGWTGVVFLAYKLYGAEVVCFGSIIINYFWHYRGTNRLVWYWHIFFSSLQQHRTSDTLKYYWEERYFWFYCSICVSKFNYLKTRRYKKKENVVNDESSHKNRIKQIIFIISN